MPWPPQTRLQCLRQALEKEQILAQKGRILQSALRTAKIGKEKQKEKERNTEIFGTPFIIGKTVLSLKNGTRTQRKKGEKGKIIKIYTDQKGVERLIVNFNQCGQIYFILQFSTLSACPTLKQLHKIIGLRILENDSETWWQKKYKNFSVIKQKSDEFRLLSIEKKKNKLLWDKKNKVVCLEVKSKNWKEFLKGKNTQKITKIYQKRIDKLMKENTDIKNNNTVLDRKKNIFSDALMKIRNLTSSSPYLGRMSDIGSATGVLWRVERDGV